MKKIFFLLFFVVLLSTFCKNNRQISNSSAELDSIAFPYKIDLVNTINNVKSVPLSSIGENIEYIPMETKPYCLIRRIDQIAFSDSFIFISDIDKLLQFDRNGRFIRQIGSTGRGPEEYLGIFDICIDKVNEFIFILSANTRKVLRFDFNGHFINSFDVPFISWQLVLKDTNSLMFHLVNRSLPGVDSVFSWYITSTSGKTLLKIKYYPRREKVPEYLVGINPLYDFNETIHFMDFGIDTLYYFNNSNREPYAIFNLGNLKMDIEPDFFSEETRDNLNKKFWFYTIIEDKINLYLNLMQGSGGPIASGIYNKQSSEVVFLANGGFLNDLDGGPDFWPKEIYNDSTLVDFIDAHKLLDLINKILVNEGGKLDRNTPNKFETLKTQLRETSNPILMLVN